jgi:NADPH-dependent curcumin reductase CurA
MLAADVVEVHVDPDGIAATADAFLNMLAGGNIGKMVVRLDY